MVFQRPRWVAAVGLSLLASGIARGDYAFTRIADTAGPFFNFGPASRPALNNAGTVAFFGNTDFLADGGTGIFTGSGGSTAIIVSSTTDPSFFSVNVPSPSINDAGTAAFLGVGRSAPLTTFGA